MELSEVKQLIEENWVAFATADEEGNPHCIAVADVKVVSENQILIGDNYMAQTKKNLETNQNVSLVVSDGDDGFGLKGTAEYIRGGKWLDEVKKIHEGCPTKAAILVTISKIVKLSG